MAVLGCIADDFTGASDAASFLFKGGMRVQLYNGVPDPPSPNHAADAQAMVIALKSRTQDTAQAVEDSVKAARFLLAQGTKQLYFKYCSTFDSTPRGNIGPVSDALLELTGATYTLLCPALPVNGRTVENGCLMVNGIPLHESHMKNHPLTPMWDCRIDELMRPQSKYPCYREMPRQTQERPFYLIPDYKEDADGAAIAADHWHLPLLTGGSGLLEPLAQHWARELNAGGHAPECATEGKALLLAGSCSSATLGQIDWYQKAGNPSYKLDPEALLQGRQSAEDAWQFITAHTTNTKAVLVYSSDTPEKVQEYQRFGTETVAALLEETFAQLAVRAVNSGFTRVVSAGGETSGAVTQALNFSSYWMGESVAPGVPIMTPTQRPDVRLILKSGNFGQEDFFGRALTMTHK